MIHELSRARHGKLPGRQLRRAARHAVRVGNLRLREGRVHRRARSQARHASSWPTRARSSSTRSATCRSSRRPSCCACSRSGASNAWARNKSIHVDFRLISATNRPLDQFVRDSRFREDLYYRVNAFSIRLPSLRERPVDIPVLAQRFLARYCAAQRTAARREGLLEGSGRLPDELSWPGNIRELESTVSRAALSSPGRIDPRCRHRVPPRRRHSRRPTPRRAAAVARRSRARAHRPRARSDRSGTRRRPPGVLDISRGTLYRKIVEYGLEPASPRKAS